MTLFWHETALTWEWAADVFGTALTTYLSVIQLLSLWCLLSFILRFWNHVFTFGKKKRYSSSWHWQQSIKALVLSTVFSLFISLTCLYVSPVPPASVFISAGVRYLWTLNRWIRAFICSSEKAARVLRGWAGRRAGDVVSVGRGGKASTPKFWLTGSSPSAETEFEIGSPQSGLPLSVS